MHFTTRHPPSIQQRDSWSRKIQYNVMYKLLTPIVNYNFDLWLLQLHSIASEQPVSLQDLYQKLSIFPWEYHKDILYVTPTRPFLATFLQDIWTSSSPFKTTPFDARKTCLRGQIPWNVSLLPPRRWTPWQKLPSSDRLRRCFFNI